MTHPYSEVPDFATIDVEVATADADVRQPTTAQKYRAHIEGQLPAADRPPLYEEVERHPLGSGLVAIYVRRVA